ncbi:hypothetical protein P9597_03425 [Aneurinibacillus migulanus]|uniref:hypothetical protein n=1 Tax=Aneurinibacillus migulanus TaxID=47500 RepID=UPI002E21A6BE|nr:hypothetical protein [Aneurinibacillus migulanus]
MEIQVPQALLHLSKNNKMLLLISIKLHVIDNNFQSYQILMFKSTGDILQEDKVRFWGVPAGSSSFSNVSGGTTNVQLFVGAHVEKQGK